MSNILVVEDDAMGGMLLSAFLKREGHDVNWVRNPADVARACAEVRYDVVISDYLLASAMDGVDVLEIVHRMMPAATTIMITGLPEEHIAARVSRTRVDFLMSKPLDLDHLASALMRTMAAPPG